MIGRASTGSLAGKVVFTFFPTGVFVEHLAMLVEASSIRKKDHVVLPAHVTKFTEGYSARRRIKENSVQHENI